MKKLHGSKGQTASSAPDSARLNNAQRKALVELAERRFHALIQRAKDKNGELTEQITTQVKKELGVVALEEQIAQFEQKIEFLKTAKARLGFDRYGVEGKAKMLIDQRSRDANKDEIALVQQKDALLQKLWLAQTVSETESLLAGIPAV